MDSGCGARAASDARGGRGDEALRVVFGPQGARPAQLDLVLVGRHPQHWRRRGYVASRSVTPRRVPNQISLHFAHVELERSRRGRLRVGH